MCLYSSKCKCNLLRHFYSPFYPKSKHTFGCGPKGTLQKDAAYIVQAEVCGGLALGKCKDKLHLRLGVVKTCGRATFVATKAVVRGYTHAMTTMLCITACQNVSLPLRLAGSTDSDHNPFQWMGPCHNRPLTACNARDCGVVLLAFIVKTDLLNTLQKAVHCGSLFRGLLLV